MISESASASKLKCRASTRDRRLRHPFRCEVIPSREFPGDRAGVGSAVPNCPGGIPHRSSRRPERSWNSPTRVTAVQAAPANHSRIAAHDAPAETPLRPRCPRPNPRPHLAVTSATPSAARSLARRMAPAARTYAAALAAQVASTLGLFAAPIFLSAALESLARSQGATPEGGDRLLETVGRWLPSADEPVQLVLLAAAGSLVASVIAAGFQYIRGRLAAQASEGLVLDLRRQVYDRLQRLPEAWFSTRESGDLVQRATSDVETLRAFLAVQIVEVGRSATLLCVALPILLLLDPILALASVALYPAIGFLAWSFFRRVRKRFQSVDEAEGAMTAVLQENLTGVRVVRAFGRGDHERERFARANAKHRDALEGWIRLLGRFWGTSDLLCLSQLGLTLFVGAGRVLDGQLGVGELFAFITYAGLLIWPVRQLGRVLSETGKALVAVERLDEVLDSQPESDAPHADAPRSLQPGGGFRVQGLTVRFEDNPTPVLAELDLELAPGETLALVGPPGAGKSTLLNALTRLIDPSSGSIEISGIDALSAPRAWVRQQLAVVPQEAFLFSKSLRDNLRAAAEEADDERLWVALEAAAVAGDVRNMERGLDSEVGERGVTLSGGQRQRTTLARALLRESPVLILDDSLSAVDTATEQAILGALERREGSALIVTHRLSAARAADRIAVLEAGVLVELGTHAELLAIGGRYARDWRAQEAELDAALTPTPPSTQSNPSDRRHPQDSQEVS